MTNQTKQLLIFGLIFSVYLLFFTIHLVKEATQINHLYDNTPYASAQGGEEESYD